MAVVTIQVLEGLERGRTFERLPLPVTIGREEENSIRLNDERISRFHAKLQEDAGRIILTDLDSTNGTRVNGRAVQMRVLRPGDQFTIGRCLLLFGSPEEIAMRADKQRANPADDPLSALDEPPSAGESSMFLSGLLDETLPETPSGLSPGQRAQLSDLLDFAHDEIRRVLLAAEEMPSPTGGELMSMRVSGRGWQRLLKLEMEIARALRRIAEPDESHGS